MPPKLKPVDRVEILTLQDNFVDLAAMDGTPIVQRALPIKDLEIRNSIGAEHGFSALVTVEDAAGKRGVLFDFGFSERGALNNADALAVDLSSVEALVLSHGHMDHHGGLAAFLERIDRKGIELVLHPAAFRPSRYVKASESLKLRLPALCREMIDRAGASIVEATRPHPLLDGAVLFLGEISRTSSFEKGFPRMHYEEAGEEKWDPIEDDSAIVAHLRGKGLVILSGCAHSGIVNTVAHARQVTGVDDVFAVMGGFHLTGPDFEPVIQPTADALGQIGPRYIVPTHCTGRKAVLEIERRMPDRFLLNMSGTRMVFAA